MELKRQVVMVDPRKIRDKDLFPEEIARVEFVSDVQKDIAIVHFDERGIYNAYHVSELLAIFPEQLIFENLCNSYYKLDRSKINKAFDLVSQYQLRNYINAFRIALKNPEVSKLCMTDLGALLKLKSRTE